MSAAEAPRTCNCVAMECRRGWLKSLLPAHNPQATAMSSSTGVLRPGASARGVLGGVVDAEREYGGVRILGTVVAWGGVHAQLMPASLLRPRFQSACRRAPAGAPGSACRLVPPHRATGCAPH